jgi:hypothetical protein
VSAIHDEVQQALQDLQEEAHDLDQLAGHELLGLRDRLVATVQRIRSARVGREVAEPPIEAGAGAVESPHPEAAASEPREESRTDLEARAAREPDATVRANMLADGISEHANAERANAEELSGEALDERARELDIEGRSVMSADEKRKAVAKAEKGK